MKRFVQMVTKIKSSCKPILRSLLSILELDTRSIVGRNQRNIMLSTSLQFTTSHWLTSTVLNIARWTRKDSGGSSLCCICWRSKKLVDWTRRTWSGWTIFAQINCLYVTLFIVLKSILSLVCLQS